MFTRYEFLELFDSESFVDEEAGIVEYFIFWNEFSFSLYISPCEGVVILTLKHNNLENPLYDMSLRDVTFIEIVREKPNIVKLLFIDKNKKKLLTMFIKPELSLRPNF